MAETPSTGDLPFPGLPHPRPSLSFWLQNARGVDGLIGHRTTVELPQSAPCVIIGSGMSGATMAHYLLADTEGKSRFSGSVMLEARDVCSGATGRNGGHSRPDRFKGFAAFSRLLGAEQALKVIHHERDNLTEMAKLAAEIDCDFWQGLTYEVFMSAEARDDCFAAHEAFKLAGGDLGNVHFESDPIIALEKTRVRGALGYSSWPAASVYPHKLVTGLLRPLITTGLLNVQSHTPAIRIEGSPGQWKVRTPRGDIETPLIIHATNAFAATLLPQLAGHIEPWRGICSAHVPPSAYAGSNRLDHTACNRRGLRVFDYLIQRPSDGIVIVGGGNRVFDSGKECFRVTDDSAIEMGGGRAYLQDYMENHYEGWVNEAEGEGCISIWTGIMGYTKDSVPFAGSVLDLPGQFICAGFHGHGMARIATVARDVAKLIQGCTWADTTLPECFAMTRDRLQSDVDVFAEYSPHQSSHKQPKSDVDAEGVNSV